MDLITFETFILHFLRIIRRLLPFSSFALVFGLSKSWRGMYAKMVKTYGMIWDLGMAVLRWRWSHILGTPDFQHYIYHLLSQCFVISTFFLWWSASFHFCMNEDEKSTWSIEKTDTPFQSIWNLEPWFFLWTKHCSRLHSSPQFYICIYPIRMQFIAKTDSLLQILI